MSNPPTGISRSSFHIALSAIIVCSAIVWSSGNLAACADMFDHEMRKLHSKQQVDICKLVGGKPALIINTASHCGYTRQFKGLEALYQRYKDQGLVVIGFASDDFNQEANDEGKTAELCELTYGVKFPMFEPTSVKGEDADPMYKMLQAATGKSPAWNFNKYLVNADGTTVIHYPSSTTPDDPKFVAALEEMIAN